ncbi:4-hydroxy-2-oxoglutarate aldolase [Geosmithia morbida]|uniref:4-hydroxy-2-oxoglutarate aldolase n=1 Tax=Geosmithia morbida TaxID=1094350 RepID=A0A9P4YZW6_9HYPO|nr:4-hydroxy-2-oxoglutarate aldolase [Geosmithia morbida]KAF4124852.1 4-hydroxy-2-oxoglutarate aldolase [Geosmithia morbida]
MGSQSHFPHVPAAGVWCPAITFFDQSQDEIDFNAQNKYFSHLSRSGLTGIVAMGTNSEAFLLTREERYQLIANCRASVGPDFPIMAGVGAHSTKQTIELAQDAAKAGANYLLILPPAYFGKATSMAIVRSFFAKVAASVSLPVVIYNFPGVCNGVDIDSDTIVAIVKQSAAASSNGISNIVGVKLTCGSVGKITRLAAELSASEFSTYGGQSDFLIGGLAAGSAGCIAAFANVSPKLTSEIYRLYKEGKYAEATDLQQKAALAERPCKAGIAATKYTVSQSTARLAGIEDAEQKLLPRHPYEGPGEGVKEGARRAIAEVVGIETKLLQ